MTGLPRNLVGRIILQARDMELREQPAALALLSLRQPHSAARPSTLLVVYRLHGRSICKIARYNKGSRCFGPTVSVPLPEGGAAATIAYIASAAEMALVFGHHNSQTDLLCGLTDAKAATDLLARADWQRGVLEEVRDKLVLPAAVSNLETSSELLDALTPFVSVALA